RQAVRPAAKPAPVRTGLPIIERIRRYLREVRTELGRVDWPSRAELTAMTIVVVVVLLLMSLYLGAWDLLFTWLFQRGLVRQ
ncbi:MAG TPA: preprotein translocase subunit SecE, partial [bacterium]|nr:preprotein translocase subunit SecE [bacterium]